MLELVHVDDLAAAAQESLHEWCDEDDYTMDVEVWERAECRLRGVGERREWEL
ncbi:MAG: hypothetical protein R3E01_14215 [Pirellulaceae bacterium]|nr:hypothetical protein [Planctomycetales bacterium]